jgi:predicted CXXCH cytochrome family protein
MFVPLSVFAAKQPQKYTSLHHFQLPCYNCHIPGSSDSPDQQQQRKIAWQVSGDINRQCATPGCHDFDPMLSHPIGVRSQGIVPTDMPLDNDMRITCLTCHDKAESSENSIETGSGSERSLYTPQGIKFCVSCHMNMGGTIIKQSHWQFSTSAHLISGKSQFKESANFEQFNGGIDPESLSCLSCHDNITVTIPAQNEITRQKKLRRQNMTDHPIGMEYRDVAMRSLGDYKFPLFSNRIRLFNGRVGCGSCHSLYSQTNNYLVEPEERGLLCRKCHNK